MADTPTAALDHPERESRRRRPLLVLWAVLAALAIGAGAVVVLGGDGDPPRLPIALGAGGGDGARAETAAADLSMMAWIRYGAGDDLPTLGGDGHAFRMADAVSNDRLAAVARALGLDGEVVELPGGDGSLQVEGDDGAVLGAGPYAGGTWWYTSAALARGWDGGSGGGSGVACPTGDGLTDEELKRCEETLVREREAVAIDDLGAEGCPPDADCAQILPVPDVGRPAPPADLPSRDEAEAIALELFRGLGVDLDGARVTVDGPHDAWYVSIEPRIDGLAVSGYLFSASVGSGGEITTAGGVLNPPTRLGSYPTVDTRGAVDRLNAQMSGFGGGDIIVDDMAVDDVATAPPCDPDAEVDPAAGGVASCAAPTAVDPVPAPCPVEGPGAGVDRPAAAPQIDGAEAEAIVPDEEGCPEVGPVEPPQPIEVVLHDAERILVLAPSTDGTPVSYLVPGYRLQGDDDVLVDVIAVDDASLAPPPTRGPAVVEPGPAEDTPGAVDGSPGCAPVEPGPGGAVPDICLDPRSVEPAPPAGSGAGSTGSGPVVEPDAPVGSPMGER